MIAFDEALQLVRDAGLPLGIERVALGEAAGRTLADHVTARVDAPPADCSAMDGYAVRASDLPGSLRVVGESLPGSGYAETLQPGCCVRIFTGAPTPAGADQVIIQETVERNGAYAVMPARDGGASYIRRRGSDFRVGDEVVPAGASLTARALVAAAAADVADLAVWRKPTLFVLATGDELAEPGHARGLPGTKPESASYGVCALAEQAGAIALGTRRLWDDPSTLAHAAGEALDRADLIVVTGGASVGERDFAKSMFETHGLEIIFSKVSMRPGKPVWLGRVRNRLVLGLPGNPTSAMVTGRLLLVPLVARLAGSESELDWFTISLAGPLPAGDSRETFVRAQRTPEGALPAQNQDSAAQQTLAASDLLLRLRPGDQPRKPGDLIDALTF